MIDADSRTLRIRVTGRAQSAKGPVTRSVIAALKRDSFLDFLWFTDYETSDPVWYSVRSNGRPTGGPQGDLLTWAANNCPEYYRSPWNRGNENWDGKFTDDNSSYPGSVGCDNIAFITGDKLLGPHAHQRRAAGLRHADLRPQRPGPHRVGQRLALGRLQRRADLPGHADPRLEHDRHAGHQRLAGHGGSRRRLHLHGPDDDQVRHRAGQDHGHQPADLQQHADGLPEQRRHLRQGQRLVPAVLRAAIRRTRPRTRCPSPSRPTSRAAATRRSAGPTTPT